MALHKGHLAIKHLRAYAIAIRVSVLHSMQHPMVSEDQRLMSMEKPAKATNAQPRQRIVKGAFELASH
jgi:hypothetical protein